MRKRVMRQRHWKIKRKYLGVGRKPNMNYARRSDTHFQKVHDHKFIISCDQFWMQYFQCNVNSMYFSRVIFTSVQISVKFGYLLFASLFSTETPTSLFSFTEIYEESVSFKSTNVYSFHLLRPKEKETSSLWISHFFAGVIKAIFDDANYRAKRCEIDSDTGAEKCHDDQLLGNLIWSVPTDGSILLHFKQDRSE